MIYSSRQNLRLIIGNKNKVQSNTAQNGDNERSINFYKPRLSIWIEIGPRKQVHHRPKERHKQQRNPNIFGRN